MDKLFMLKQRTNGFRMLKYAKKVFSIMNLLHQEEKAG